MSPAHSQTRSLPPHTPTTQRTQVWDPSSGHLFFRSFGGVHWRSHTQTKGNQVAIKKTVLWFPCICPVTSLCTSMPTPLHHQWALAAREGTGGVHQHHGGGWQISGHRQHPRIPHFQKPLHVGHLTIYVVVTVLFSTAGFSSCTVWISLSQFIASQWC